jgi:hypothetical protein
MGRASVTVVLAAEVEVGADEASVDDGGLVVAPSEVPASAQPARPMMTTARAAALFIGRGYKRALPRRSWGDQGREMLARLTDEMVVQPMAGQRPRRRRRSDSTDG